MPRDRLLSRYREAYQQEERETCRARVIMADIKDDVLRSLTLPSYTQAAPKTIATSKGQRRATPAKHWLSKAVAADLVVLMESGVLVGEVFAEWPAGPDGQTLSMLWGEVAGVADG